MKAQKMRQLELIETLRLQKNFRYSQALVFATLGIWSAYLLYTFFCGIAGQRELTTWIQLLEFLGLQAIFCLLAFLAMFISDSTEEKLKYGNLYNDFASSILRSEHRYILLLRSFQSQLIVEKTSRTMTVEREQTIFFRGEEFPTGKKYKDFVHDNFVEDDVRIFIKSAIGNLHCVVIDGDKNPLSVAPLPILSTEQWIDIFEILAGNAQLIVIVPEASKSLKEEISRLKAAEALCQCVFLMPPSQTPTRATERATGWVSGLSRRNRWTESAKEVPIHLPEYDEHGAILVLSPDGDWRHLTYTATSLRSLLEERSANGHSLREVIALLDQRGLLSDTWKELQKLREKTQQSIF
jgi:hypothetical protein